MPPEEENSVEEIDYTRPIGELFDSGNDGAPETPLTGQFYSNCFFEALKAKSRIKT